MKKGWRYLILIIFELMLGIVYGFFLKNILPIELCIISAFVIPFCVLFISCKKRQDKHIKSTESLFLSLICMAVFILVFFYGNQLHGEFVGEYDVVVEDVYGRGGGYADFTTPQGEQGSVDLHDYRPIIFDDNYVEVGDTIRVQEYKGFFKESYYVFVEEIH